MGHDIYAYKQPHAKVAYLRRGAFNEDGRTIYRLLHAEEHDAGVSGNGTWETFYRNQLEEAAAQAEREDAAEDIRAFLKLALKADSGDDGILIFFG